MNIVIVADSFLNSSRIQDLFSPEEMADLSKCVSSSSLQQTLLGRAALKRAASPTSPIDIVASYNELGQPFIKGQNTYCTISHSYDVAVAAVSAVSIGVDIEKVRFHDPRLLSYIASQAEIALFRDSHPEVVVTKAWVIKESVAKALGVGIKHSFIDIVIQKTGNEFTLEAGGIVWQVSLLEYGNYIIAYALPKLAAPTEVINVQYLI